MLIVTLNSNTHMTYRPFGKAPYVTRACYATGRTRPRSHRRQRRAPSMPRATTSPTAGASPVQSSTPSIEDAPPVEPSNDNPVTSPHLPPVGTAPIRKPPTALNLSQSRRVRRKKSVISMPRVLPSPTVPLLHRIPGSINFPRVAGSPTPPSFSSTSASDDDDDDARSSPAPLSASRRSFPADWDSAARHRLLGRRDSDDGGSTATLRRRTSDRVTAEPDVEADDWRWDHGTGKRRLPYVDSLPRDAATRSLLSMPTSRPERLSRSKSMPNSDTDDDEVWC